MHDVYIAAPFFNDEQLEIVESIKKLLDEGSISYFSPNDESMFKQGDDPSSILDLNCNAIDESQFIIVVTDGKDVGTIWEAGYAYGRYVPVVYLWLGYEPGMKFNIMLAASGAIAHSYDELQIQIRCKRDTGEFINNYDDGMLHE